jgi:DNA-binding winged helix-turn-helix (wHTH) protein
MRFITVRDLRSNIARLRKDLEKEREIVVTANGRPFAVMTKVEPDKVEEEILAIRRARVMAALGRIRAKAQRSSLDRLTMDEIDVVIAETRRMRRAPR